MTLVKLFSQKIVAAYRTLYYLGKEGKKQGDFEYIVGDPLLEQFGGYKKQFMNLPQIALSGRLLNDRWYE